MLPSHSNPSTAPRGGSKDARTVVNYSVSGRGWACVAGQGETSGTLQARELAMETRFKPAWACLGSLRLEISARRRGLSSPRCRVRIQSARRGRSSLVMLLLVPSHHRGDKLDHLQPIPLVLDSTKIWDRLFYPRIVGWSSRLVSALQCLRCSTQNPLRGCRTFIGVDRPRP